MTMSELIKKLNEENDTNSFTLSERAAKRQRRTNQPWIIARFQPCGDWKGFRLRGGEIAIYEALPPGWPLRDMAERLNADLDQIGVVSIYNPARGRWREVEGKK